MWSLGTATSRQLTDVLTTQQQWDPSTTKTLLRRLMDKKLVEAQGAVRQRQYRATVSEAALANEHLAMTIQELCARQVGSALTDVLAQTPLSQTDIQQLQKLLAQKALVAPESLACNCLPDSCQCHNHQNNHCQLHGENNYDKTTSTSYASHE